MNTIKNYIQKYNRLVTNIKTNEQEDIAQIEFFDSTMKLQKGNKNEKIISGILGFNYYQKEELLTNIDFKDIIDVLVLFNERDLLTLRKQLREVFNNPEAEITLHTRIQLHHILSNIESLILATSSNPKTKLSLYF